MGVELQLLIWAVVLTFVQVLIAVAGSTQVNGLTTLAGNREGLQAPSGWAGRAERAHRNMLESLPLFAALVLVAQVSGHLNAMTALGAQIFFWARLVYAVIYLIGIPWARTLVWLVSVVGLILIFLQLI